jgi:hypothetical protein
LRKGYYPPARKAGRLHLVVEARGVRERCRLFFREEL